VKSPTGYPMQSPYLAIANRQAELMMRIASEFGFTPASRSRISAPPPDQLPLLDLTAPGCPLHGRDQGVNPT
jgi:Phage terminase, small subunit